MKLYKLPLLLALVLLSVISCSETPSTTEKAATTSKELAVNTETTEFNIDGMMCPTGCAANIQKSLAGLEGVSYAKVDFESKKAKVSYDSSKLTEEQIATTVTTIGDGHTYKVYNMAKVAPEEHGGGNGKTETHDCSATGCTGKCTAEMKANCTPEMEANCPMKKKV